MPHPGNIIYPVSYRITIEPDLNRRDFKGSAELILKAQTPAARIELNSLELAVMRCEYKSQNDWITSGFTVKPGAETLEIHLPEEAEGEIEIRIHYYGRINDKMAGFYRSIVKTEQGSETIAVTQFQESDARRAFPCMDHPLFKAEFELSLVIDKNLTAVSNMPVASETPHRDGKKQVTFQKTPPMSTYLVFFAMGSFSLVTDELDRRVRAAAAAGMESGVHYSLSFARKALHYCEDYFRIPYPLPKLDLIAVPDFAFGAMENWGAVTFRENLVRHEPGYTSAEGEERICEVIAHEIVHQWFGNLVTPRDWKYLWLNESFATFFGYEVVNSHHPDWQTWEEFLESQTGSALSRDGLTDTSAIEIRGGDHVVINSATAPVIYSKGGSILRQIKNYVGDEGFRAALNSFLEKHAYGCSSSNDLWAAMEEKSGKPIEHIMKQWITLAGHPLVCAERRQNTLLLSQQRFTYLPSRSPDAQAWPIPLSIRLYGEKGESREKTFIFDTKECRIKLDDDVEAYKINDLQSGFYRVMYMDHGNLEQLGEMTQKRILPETDRWGLENDLFALALSGRISLPEYLNHLSWCETETAPLPVSGKLNHLHALMLITKGNARKAVSATTALHLSGALNRLGAEPAANEPHGISRLRNLLIWQSAILEISGTIDIALARFNELAAGKDVHPDIIRGVMQAAAWTGNEKTFQWLVQRIETSLSEHDRLNCLRALGCFSDKNLVKKALSYVLESVPDRNKFVTVAQMSTNPAAAPCLWDWYKKSATGLQSLHPIIHERVISSVVPVGGLVKPEEVTAYFEKYLKENPPAADTVRMCLEKLDINHRFKSRAAVGSP
ncbi:MAG: M1 family metallopeptidase [Desulfobacteraceae bacterium]|nr:M1 family metallopeptidase [Desulfobacteraceae bacterium]